MRIYILLILILGLSLCCQGNWEKDSQTKSVVEDSPFHFTIKSETDFIDSKTGLLTRVFYSGKKSVHVGFTNTEMRKIEELYFELRLDTLPDKYIADCEIYDLPTFDYVFSVNYNEVKKQFTLNYGYENCDSKSVEILLRIKRFKDLIYNMLNQKKKYRNFEKSDVVFY